MPGVSGVKGMLPSPALGGWFKKYTAIYAVDNLDAVQALAEKDRTAAIELVKNSTARYSREAADRGTQIHRLCEWMMLDRMAGRKSTFRATAEEMAYLRNFAKFMVEFDVRPVAVERTVWHTEHRYAGTIDLIAELRDFPGLSIVDYKSGASGVYSDAGMQQTGYVHADSYIDEDGNFQKMPPIERAFALWLRPDGWSLYPLRTDERMFEVFLHLREVFNYVHNEADTVVGKPVNVSPLRKRWKPD